MADAIVSSIVADVVGRLTSLSAQEFELIQDFNADLHALESNFTHIGSVLQDAESKQAKDEVLLDWLRKLRAASFDMENILDEVSTEVMMQRVDSERGIINQVSAFFSARNPLVFHTWIGHLIKSIRQRVDAIAAERSKFDLEVGFGDMEVAGDFGNRLTSSLVKDQEIFGRDEEKNMIIEKICHSNSDLGSQGDDFSLYAMWGMAGIGKTTLAQLVYNDQRVKKYFDLRIWVCVSYDFDMQWLTRAILEHVDDSCSNIAQLDLLLLRLREKLQGKRFLLVLDDVWDVDETKWEGLRQILSFGTKGSMAMVTTRIETTARMMARHPEFVHHIGCLSEDESWSLFTRLAFGVGRTGGKKSELEPIGRKIVEKCKGLPLAVKAMGSLMWSKSSASEWSLTLASEIWDLPEDQQLILPALKLSYDCLPQHFKQCFAYCCLFPKDYKMSKDLLIKLWMANGLIPSRSEADLYLCGEEIFKGLVWRSFLQDVVDSGGQLACKMHDLMHDLAQFVIGNECAIIEPEKEIKFPAEVLHVSLTQGPSRNQDFSKVTRLRSLILLNGGDIETTPSLILNVDSIPGQISNLKCIRVLDSTCMKSRRLPKSICNLRHLRYLNLSYSDIKVLPESFIYLQNLQVLNLKSCKWLLKLPTGMRYLKNLQFLDIQNCDSLLEMPAGMGQLVRLRELGKFIVGRKPGKEIGELGKLNFLGGEIEIVGLDNVRGLEDAKGAGLKCKPNLKSLRLVRFTGQSEKDEEILEGLEPHPNLKKLVLDDYWGLKFPSWTEKLINLSEVTLERCVRFETLPALGTLPALRVFRLKMMFSLKSFHDDSLECYNYSSTLFPCLEELYIDWCIRLIRLPSDLLKVKVLSILGCDDLVSLPEGIGNFSSLSHLTIEHCPNLMSLPDGLQNLKALKELEINECELLKGRCDKDIGEDWHKISHVPIVQIDYKDVQWLP